MYELGCIACHIKGKRSEAQIHHVLSGHYRQSHDETIPLCPYHHEGVPPGEYTVSMMESAGAGPPGPPRAPRFKAEFGDEEGLISATNDAITL